MLKNNLQKRKELRQAFKATITQDQKDILSDPRVMPAERMKSFRASFTDQQVSIIKSNRKEIKAMKDEFRSTLSAEQKIQLRKMAVKRGRMNRFSNTRLVSVG
jgi:vacuolar-type H+-ATPase subunit I/STV1